MCLLSQAQLKLSGVSSSKINFGKRDFRMTRQALMAHAYCNFAGSELAKS
jgi:hypothetical protein